MADETQDKSTPGASPAASPVIPQPQSTVDPAYIAALEQYRDAWEGYREKASPYADDIQRLIEDAEYRDFTKQSWETFQEAKKRAAPRISADAQAVIETVKPALEYVQTQQQREKQAAEAAQAEYVRKQQEYARKLMADQGVDTNFIEGLAAYAIQRKTDLEGAWNEMNSKFHISTRKADTPPTSLRADAATPGVPGRSEEKPATTREDFLDGLRRAAKRAMAR